MEGQTRDKGHTFSLIGQPHELSNNMFNDLPGFDLSPMGKKHYSFLPNPFSQRSSGRGRKDFKMIVLPVRVPLLRK